MLVIPCDLNLAPFHPMIASSSFGVTRLCGRVDCLFVVQSVLYWFRSARLHLPKRNGQWSMVKNGLYNLGTGEARTFIDLVKATFAGLNREPNIEYIDMPEDIRDKYQYFTEANMQKLRNIGYNAPFTSLEAGVGDYVRNYLRTLG